MASDAECERKENNDVGCVRFNESTYNGCAEFFLKWSNYCLLCLFFQRMQSNVGSFFCSHRDGAFIKLEL